jgi:prefoldin beta subunit
MAAQRLQLELQLKEVERALEELKKLDENVEVYKSVGNLLVKGEKGKIEEELSERKETLSLRVKTLQRQEEKLQTRLKEMQTKIQEVLRGYQKAG